MSKVLIVGAGLYGATVARQLADAGHDIFVIERRDHIGGNVFTKWNDEAECHEHVYGAHIFHTSNMAVWGWVTSFVDFMPYRHIVRARAGGTLYPFPINLQTLHQVFGVSTPETAAAAMLMDSVPCDEIGNVEQWCRHHIGNRLYELFVEGYSTKQWGCSPFSLPTSIIKRIPVRLTHDDTYFSDRYQGIPIGGYTLLVERILGGIRVALNSDFNEDPERYIGAVDMVVYTGGIDSFFRYTLGALGYRSLRFTREMVDEDDAQGVSVINHCDITTPWTRTIEHRHFMGRDMNTTGQTLVTTEHPSDEGEPFYPINTGANQVLLRRYRKLAAQHFPTVVFGGRLGEYRYLDMHQVIASALAKSIELGARLR